MSSTDVFSDYMKEIGAYPKLRFTGDKKELIFVKAERTTKVDPTGKEKPAVKIIVRDRSDGEIKQWVTESLTVIDTLRAAKIEPKTLFTAMPTKRGAKKGYMVEVMGLVNEADNEA